MLIARPFEQLDRELQGLTWHRMMEHTYLCNTVNTHVFYRYQSSELSRDFRSPDSVLVDCHQDTRQLFEKAEHAEQKEAERLMRVRSPHFQSTFVARVCQLTP